MAAMDRITLTYRMGVWHAVDDRFDTVQGTGTSALNAAIDLADKLAALLAANTRP